MSFTQQITSLRWLDNGCEMYKLKNARAKRTKLLLFFYFKYANLWRSCHLLGGCLNSLTMPGVWANMKSCSARQQMVFEIYFSLQIFNLLKPVDFYTLLMLISSSERLKKLFSVTNNANLYSTQYQLVWLTKYSAFFCEIVECTMYGNIYELNFIKNGEMIMIFLKM